jgi:hypothetical protein
MPVLWYYLELRLMREIFAMAGVQYLFWIGVGCGILWLALKETVKE